jgi:SAM-dependent methyltransferase
MTWQQAWQEGRTGWDAGAAAPALVHLLKERAGQRGGGDAPTAEVGGGPPRALVPGCGSGYDVLALAQAGYRTTGLDLSPLARDRCHALRDEAEIPAERAAVVVDDFFTVDAGAIGAPFDLIFDYTFLCAIDVAERPRWAKRMDALLAPHGRLVTLIFPMVDEPMNPGGPPHPLWPEQVRALLEPLGYEAEVLGPAPKSHGPREGREWLGVWRRG